MSWVVTAIAVTAVASTGYEAYNVKRSADEAKRAAKNQQKATDALAEQQKNNALQAAMRLQKNRGVSSDAAGLRDTILTSPIGVVGTGASSGGKTLIGT